MTQQTWRYVWATGIMAMALQLCSQQQLPYNPTDVASETKSTSARLMYKPPTLPTSLSFAGEPVPLHVPDVAERLDKELLKNSYFHSNTLLALKRMHRHLPEIERLLRENDIPEDFKYLALAESLFGNVTSHAGASGFWQLMPSTARGYGMIVNKEVDERFHVEKSTLAACRYLKTAKKRFGSWTNAAASYNRGMGGLARALERQGVSSYYDLYLNAETSRYMFRILALKEVLGSPERYGFDFSAEQGYKPLPSRPYKVDSSIRDLPAFALEQGTNYKTLRLYNPWIKGYSLTVPSGKEFVLQLPE
ncbi:transglycosylase-like protein with SLT domain [Pontibacter ummariensis]|uniref:Transglycosylase SLT domain-containing protein n=1 Tax=Pontibacter ummariensis TaxID=1610492 RepID=A0A239D387_9BACT|nr:lytic transglycosylase domain-containing protein [Pontibacter ummariensis]PRY14225.1 transglycosylase-like protein with SLT domain [Pontibacter ummariensis]SNS26875.1 Transglycosylase SLT domain-containing protein [Pontibacter ummariensis]